MVAQPKVAVILAGGLGSRLRPVVSDLPKSLARVAGQPFLAYLLAYLAEQGIERTILSIGYLGDLVFDFVEEWQRSHSLPRLETVMETVPLGTAGALRLASAGINSPFFALNGDTLFKVKLTELWSLHQSLQSSHNNCVATIALLPITSLQARGYVNLGSDGKIHSFTEKPSTLKTYPGRLALINGGVYILEPSALVDVPPNQAMSIERQVFPALAVQGQLGGLVQEAYFADIGTPESLATFEQDLLHGVV